MNKLAFTAILIAALAATGCVKSTSDATVKGDGTATVKMALGYNKKVIEDFKAMIESQMGGEEDGGADGPGAQFDKFESGFDDKKVAQAWKELGLEVGKAATVEKDGWKTVEIEGTGIDQAGVEFPGAFPGLRLGADGEAEQGQGEEALARDTRLHCCDHFVGLNCRNGAGRNLARHRRLAGAQYSFPAAGLLACAGGFGDDGPRCVARNQDAKLLIAVPGIPTRPVRPHQ